MAGILGLVLALYGRTFTFEFSYLDDDVLIADNHQALSRPSAVWRCFSETYLPAHHGPSYYRPFVNSSFAVDALWGGGRPGAYHVTNVLLHGLAALLLFQLLRRLRYGDYASLCGALVFVAHPALAETVAWIPGRNDSLLTTFALSSWLCLLSHEGTPERQLDVNAVVPIAQKVAHHVAFLAALLTKEAALVLPIAFLIYRIFVERQSWRAALRPWLWGGWALAIGVYLVARGFVTALDAPPISVGLALRNFPAVVIGGLGKLVVPAYLSVLAIPEDTRIWPGLLACTLIVAVLLIQKRSQRRTFFGLSWFTLLLLPGLPASNLLILENRLYLPAVGIIIAVADSVSGDAIPKRLRIAGATLTVGALAFLSFNYGGSFRDRTAFAQAAVDASPHSSLAHRNLGVAQHLTGNLIAARHQYDEALTQDSGEPVVHNNLAVILMGEGNLPAAERELCEELRINPNYAQARHNMAVVLDALGRHAEADNFRDSPFGAAAP